MEWYVFQHGWKGLVLLLLLVLVPMCIGMARGEVDSKDWLLAPVYSAALAFAIVGGLTLLFPLARIAVGLDESGWIAGAVGTVLCVSGGYITGRRYSLRLEPPEHIKGTRVSDARGTRSSKD